MELPLRTPSGAMTFTQGFTARAASLLNRCVDGLWMITKISLSRVNVPLKKISCMALNPQVLFSQERGALVTTLFWQLSL